MICSGDLPTQHGVPVSSESPQAVFFEDGMPVNLTTAGEELYVVIVGGESGIFNDP